MIDETDTVDPAEGQEKIWERNRRLRQAELEASAAHAQQRAQRYGGDVRRQRFALVDRAAAKRRRRR